MIRTESRSGSTLCRIMFAMFWCHGHYPNVEDGDPKIVVRASSWSVLTLIPVLRGRWRKLGGGDVDVVRFERDQSYCLSETAARVKV